MQIGQTSSLQKKTRRVRFAFSDDDSSPNEEDSAYLSPRSEEISSTQTDMDSGSSSRQPEQEEVQLLPSNEPSLPDVETVLSGDDEIDLNVTLPERDKGDDVSSADVIVSEVDAMSCPSSRESDEACVEKENVSEEECSESINVDENILSSANTHETDCASNDRPPTPVDESIVDSIAELPENLSDLPADEKDISDDHLMNQESVVVLETTESDSEALSSASLQSEDDS